MSPTPLLVIIQPVAQHGVGLLHHSVTTDCRAVACVSLSLPVSIIRSSAVEARPLSARERRDLANQAKRSSNESRDQPPELTDGTAATDGTDATDGTERTG